MNSQKEIDSGVEIMQALLDVSRSKVFTTMERRYINSVLDDRYEELTPQEQKTVLRLIQKARTE